MSPVLKEMTCPHLLCQRMTSFFHKEAPSSEGHGKSLVANSWELLILGSEEKASYLWKTQNLCEVLSFWLEQFREQPSSGLCVLLIRLKHLVQMLRKENSRVLARTFWKNLRDKIWVGKSSESFQQMVRTQMGSGNRLCDRLQTESAGALGKGLLLTSKNGRSVEVRRTTTLGNDPQQPSSPSPSCWDHRPRERAYFSSIKCQD